MRQLLAISIVAAAAALAGCSGSPAPRTPPPPGGEPGPPPGEPTEPAGDPPPAAGADGATCLAASDCASGVCEGQGCTDDQPGRCASAHRGCTKDLRPYCGCDGQTFHTSGSCPGQRYVATGDCPHP